MIISSMFKRKCESSAHTIAVVIGIGSYNDIGLIRSCGECGIKSIYLVHVDSIIIPINKSRYAIRTEYIDLNNLRQTLSDIQTDYPSSDFIVFPASDAAVVCMDEIAASLPPNFKTSHANSKISLLMDKLVMEQMAKEAGLSTPQTESLNLLEDYIPKVDFPIILKPIKSIAGNKSDITICDNQEDLTNALNTLKDKGYKEILYQKYLHNSNSKEIGITGISYPDGKIEIHGYIDKIRNRANINNFGKYFPKSSIPILTQLESYIRSTRYVGIFDTDFILFDNQLYFIECNFRNGAYGYCVTKAGFNMPGLIASAFLGKNVIKKQKLRNITFMEERTDILNALQGTVSKAKWLWQMLSADTLLWWNWRDPMPTLAHYWDKLRREI